MGVKAASKFGGIWYCMIPFRRFLLWEKGGGWGVRFNKGKNARGYVIPADLVLLSGVPEI